ncbi:LysR family transcriptional regulator [Nakamurella antarctica]|uniref:LysR family transcriptional regulator n=1 Tax=Nakamurella antarctica TaxID=1902245 RepID=A0A3G8ZR92_9ACTN|nr:LysR family transcriptional regulator [Nakamurella antarctica]AZI57074.1 LysR family transcriptional regulator [Nakamurella antarctica]
MIDVRRLEILRELDRCGTIAATAEAVFLTPSAVSQQMAALSREAGTPMLEPDGRRVRITAAAQILLTHAHAIFTHLEHAESDLAAFRRGHVGTVRLGSFPSAIRGLAVPTWKYLADRSNLQVQVREVQPEFVADSLLSRTVDLAITAHASDGLIEAFDPRLSVEHLVDDVLDIALPLDHPLAAKSSIDLAELARDDWIMGVTGSKCWDVTKASCAAAGFTPIVKHIADEYLGVVALVCSGAGIALIPRLAQDTFVNEPMVLRPATGAPPLRKVCVQYRTGTADQPHISSTLEALRIVAALSCPAPGKSA